VSLLDQFQNRRSKWLYSGQAKARLRSVVVSMPWPHTQRYLARFSAGQAIRATPSRLISTGEMKCHSEYRKFSIEKLFLT